MPTELPQARPEPGLLRFVRRLGWLRANAFVWTLIWRLRIAGAVKSTAVGVGWVALFLSQREWRAGVWFFRLATAILIVAAWIKPDPAFVSNLLQRHSRPRDGGE